MSRRKKIILSIFVFIVLFSFIYYGARKIAYDIFFNIGTRLEEKGDIIGAIKNLEKAAEFAWSQSSIYARIGDVGIREYDEILVNKKVSKLGKEASLEVSVTNFMKALKFNPQNPWGWSGLSEYYERKSYLIEKDDVINISKLPYGELGKLDYEDWIAIITVKKAIELEPNNHFYHGLLGFILMENNIIKSGLEYYKRSIEILPIPDKHFFIPNKSIPEEMRNAIETGLTNALESNELIRKAKIYSTLAEWTLNQRKFDLATEYYKKAMEEGYDKYVILGKLGMICYLQNDYDKSLSYLLESIKGDHDISSGMNVIGEILCKKDNHGDAINYFKQAKHNVTPTKLKQIYLFKIAREYEHLEDFLNAESYYLKAIEIDPNNANAYSLIIRFYQKIGNFEKYEKYKSRLEELNSRKNNNF